MLVERKIEILILFTLSNTSVKIPRWTIKRTHIEGVISKLVERKRMRIKAKRQKLQIKPQSTKKATHTHTHRGKIEGKNQGDGYSNRNPNRLIITKNKSD